MADSVHKGKPFCCICACSGDNRLSDAKFERMLWRLELMWAESFEALPSGGLSDIPCTGHRHSAGHGTSDGAIQAGPQHHRAWPAAMWLIMPKAASCDAARDHETLSINDQQLCWH
jgi:hypothetical protein